MPLRFGVLQVQSFTVESVLAGILYMRVQHYTQQLALVTVLDLLLQQQPQVVLWCCCLSALWCSQLLC